MLDRDLYVIYMWGCALWNHCFGRNICRLSRGLRFLKPYYILLFAELSCLSVAYADGTIPSDLCSAATIRVNCSRLQLIVVFCISLLTVRNASGD
jgi:hypothetical protein